MRFHGEPDGADLEVTPEVVVVAGFTGRDRADVAAHIHELAAAGVPVPDAVPAFYLVPPALLQHDGALVTVEPVTSGEVEYALIVRGDEWWVGVASDHTDRAAETRDIALSKRACPKVVGRSVWRYADVAGHWDQLRLASWIGGDTAAPGEARQDGEPGNAGARGEAGDTASAGLALYQEGGVAALVPPPDLVQALRWRRRPECFVLLGGTVPAIGGLRYGRRFHGELRDPVRGLALTLDYRVDVRDWLEPASPGEEGNVRHQRSL